MWVSYPHMPTGAIADKEQLKKLVEFANNKGILLINDNPYSFVLSKNPVSLLAVEGAKSVALELNSLSKTFNMAGWRVGMVLGNDRHIGAILKVKSNMDSGMFYGIQKGAIVALRSGKEWFEELDAIYESRRQLMYELVDKLGCSYDKQAVGMFVWAKLPAGSPDSRRQRRRIYTIIALCSKRKNKGSHFKIIGYESIRHWYWFNRRVHGKGSKNPLPQH